MNVPRSLPLDYSVRNLGRKPLRAVLNGAACALVTAVIAATVAFVVGLRDSVADQGRPDVAILLSAAATRDVLRSAIQPAVADLATASVPGIVRVHGEPAVSPEMHLGTTIRLGANPDAEHPGFVRGVTPRAFLVHDAVALVDGALPGPNEVIVGRLAAAKLGVGESDLAIGATLRIEGGDYAVSGVFAAPGTTLESEIWAPLAELQGQARRDDVSAVFMRLESPDDVADADAFAQRRLDLELVCIRSSDYYGEAAAYFAPIRGLAGLMALLISLTVIVSGANTLNATVRDRRAEFATLRAMGYPAAALLRSIAIEASLLVAAGGIAGLLVAKLAVDGVAFRIGMGAFALDVDAICVLAAFGGVLALGMLGTVPAALRVGRMSIVDALKPD